MTIDACVVVSVVVPARDEEDSIDECLDALLRQTFADLEVLLVDGASSDSTREIVLRRAAADPRVRLLENPERTIPAALNVGLDHARGEYFVRIDAHAIPQADYVERIIRHLRTERWAGVGGRKHAVGGQSRWGMAIAAALNSPFGVGQSRYHFSTEVEEVDHVPFGAYPVDLLRRLGGWDRRLLVNQDFELDHRIRGRGGRLLFDPAIWTDWKCSANLADLARQYNRYGKGKALVARLHPGSVKPRQATPPLFVAALTGSVLLVPWWRVPVGLVAGAYIAFLVAGIASPARGLTPADRVRRAVAIAVMQLSWGAGFWQGLVRPGGWRRDPFARRDLSHRV